MKHELRIGNIVSYEATAHVIRALHHDICLHTWLKATADKYYSSYEELDGFPLNDDWMQKIGFFCEHKGKWEHKTFPLVIWWNERKQFYYGEALAGITLKYVHQLQNLYWCLTETELTIDDNDSKGQKETEA